MAFTLTKEEFRQKWIEALESGRYKQGRGYLHITSDNGKEEFCCLGVACELYRRHGGRLKAKKGDDNVWSYGSDDGNETELPERVRQALGAAGNSCDFNEPVTKKGRLGGFWSLVSCNDDGWTFKQIAKLIRKKPAGLFEE